MLAHLSDEQLQRVGILDGKPVGVGGGRGAGTHRVRHGQLDHSAK